MSKSPLERYVYESMFPEEEDVTLEKYRIEMDIAWRDIQKCPLTPLIMERMIKLVLNGWMSNIGTVNEETIFIKSLANWTECWLCRQVIVTKFCLEIRDRKYHLDCYCVQCEEYRDHCPSGNSPAVQEPTLSDTPESESELDLFEIAHVPESEPESEPEPEAEDRGNPVGPVGPSDLHVRQMGPSLNVPTRSMSPKIPRRQQLRSSMEFCSVDQLRLRNTLPSNTVTLHPSLRSHLLKI